jgi:hypothetical protein
MKIKTHVFINNAVSELLLFNANAAIFSYMYIMAPREQVNFQWDDDEDRFVLDHHS